MGPHIQRSYAQICARTWTWRSHNYPSRSAIHKRDDWEKLTWWVSKQWRPKSKGLFSVRTSRIASTGPSAPCRSPSPGPELPSQARVPPSGSAALGSLPLSPARIVFSELSGNIKGEQGFFSSVIYRILFWYAWACKKKVCVCGGKVIESQVSGRGPELAHSLKWEHWKMSPLGWEVVVDTALGLSGTPTEPAHF